MDFFGFFHGTRAGRERLEQHRQRLYRIAYSWTHSPALADDLVQETLTKALQKQGQLRDAGAGEAWLYSILSNCLRDHYRRQRETDDIDDLSLVDEIGPEQVSGQQEIVNKVRAAIARLPLGQRQVVTLVDIEGFSYIEVAGILAVPVGTVMSRLCRARAALKELLMTVREGSVQAVPQEATIRRIK
jgi:RNA polymerase sigma-70 factor (ECF subfamily)